MSWKPRLLVLSLLLCASSWALSARDAPIVLVLSDWSSQRAMSHIAAALLQRQGYAVDFLELSVDEQWGALRLGQVHIQVEVWEGSMGALYQRLLTRGLIVDAGSHRAVTREEWWYPLYVESLCPGLPDWRALLACAPLFATPSSYPQGRLLTGVWELPEQARIRALGLDFKVERVDAEQLWRALDAAVARQQPILLGNWEPNWVNQKYPGRFVEFPAYAPACEQDPSWGINPEFLYDCGNPRQGWLKKIAWAGLPRRWPCAFELLQQLDFDAPMLLELARWMDLEGLDETQAAQRWLERYSALWQSWLNASCTPS